MRSGDVSVPQFYFAGLSIQLTAFHFAAILENVSFIIRKHSGLFKSFRVMEGRDLFHSLLLQIPNQDTDPKEVL